VKKTQVQHETGIVNETIRLYCACSEAVLQNDQLWHKVSSPQKHTCVWSRAGQEMEPEFRTKVTLGSHMRSIP
jgi:hypothetical protein